MIDLRKISLSDQAARFLKIMEFPAPPGRNYFAAALIFKPIPLRRAGRAAPSGSFQLAIA